MKNPGFFAYWEQGWELSLIWQEDTKPYLYHDFHNQDLLQTGGSLTFKIYLQQLLDDYNAIFFMNHRIYYVFANILAIKYFSKKWRIFD